MGPVVLSPVVVHADDGVLQALQLGRNGIWGLHSDDNVVNMGSIDLQDEQRAECAAVHDALGVGFALGGNWATRRMEQAERTRILVKSSVTWPIGVLRSPSVMSGSVCTSNASM